MIHLPVPLFLQNVMKPRFARDSQVIQKKQFFDYKALQSCKDNYSLCPRTLKKCLFSTLTGWKIASLILMRGTNSPWQLLPAKLCLCYLRLCGRLRIEPTTNIHPKSAANSGTKYTTLEVHMARRKEKREVRLRPVWCHSSLIWRSRARLHLGHIAHHSCN